MYVSKLLFVKHRFTLTHKPLPITWTPYNAAKSRGMVSPSFSTLNAFSLSSTFASQRLAPFTLCTPLEQPNLHIIDSGCWIYSRNMPKFCWEKKNFKPGWRSGSDDQRLLKSFSQLSLWIFRYNPYSYRLFDSPKLDKCKNKSLNGNAAGLIEKFKRSSDSCILIPVIN